MIRELGSEPLMQIMGGRYDGSVGYVSDLTINELGQTTFTFTFENSEKSISLVTDGHIYLRELGS